MIENHVTSLELSKKLKELGVEQKSMFYYLKDSEGQYAMNYTVWIGGPAAMTEPISAFLASELGEMLPYQFKGHWLWVQKAVPLHKGWVISYSEDASFTKQLHYEQGDTMPNAMAKMLIHLKESNE